MIEIKEEREEVILSNIAIIKDPEKANKYMKSEAWVFDDVENGRWYFHKRKK